MKKLIFTAAILISCVFAKQADAQVHLSVGINIGSQPDWGPVGYDHADYYYMPDIGVYYDVPAHQYISLSNGAWVRRAYLPVAYRNYDLYHGYKVVINEPRPWRRNVVYRERYANYRGRRDQVIIRDSREEKYREHGHENGKHRGREGHEDHGRGHGGGGGHGHGHH
mgnify:CR=1 FL=1